MATLYLHECGYIHSNISTHCILVRKHPWCCKLSSFDLTTNISTKNIRKEIETKCSSSTTFNTTTAATSTLPSLLMQEKLMQKSFSSAKTNSSNSTLHRKYKKISKLLPNLHNTPNRSVHRTYIGVPTKYYQYNIEYRRHLSLHYYQAPELLYADRIFVFPTKAADVYGLTLLLWECLNNCIPYAIYNAIELEQLFVGKYIAPLPIFEQERCKLFENIFQIGLICDPTKRNIGLEHFISLLEDIKFQLNDNKLFYSANNDDRTYQQHIKPINLATFESSDCEYESLDSEIVTKEKNLNKRLNHKRNRRNLYENTNANVIDKPLPAIPKIDYVENEKVEKENLEFDNNNITLYQSLLNFNQCLTDKKNADNIERTSTLKRPSTVNEKLGKKSSRALFDNEKTTTTNNYQTLNDNLDALNTNIQLARNAVIEEFKQSIAASTSENEKNSIIGPLSIKKIDLPKIQNTVQYKIKQFDENTDEKAQIVGWKVKNDCNITNTNEKNLSDTAKLLNNLTDDEVLNLSNIKQQSINNNESMNQQQSTKSYKFNIDNYSLPTTPIALKNKIRRNTWLSSSQRLSSAANNNNNITTTEQPSKIVENNKSTNPNQSITLQDDNDNTADDTNDGKNKKLNISIRIVHNKITPTKSIHNDNDDESVENTSPRFFDKTKLTPTITRPNNNSVSECGKSFHEIVKKSSRYANGSVATNLSSTINNNNKSTNNDNTLPSSSSSSAELFQKAIEIQQKSKSSTNGHFENKLWKHEKSLCDQSSSTLNNAFILVDNDDDSTNNTKSNVIVPERLSVKDTIKQFESFDDTTNTNPIETSGNNNKNTSKLIQMLCKSACNPISSLEKSSETTTTTCDRQTLIKQTIYRESIVSGEIDLKHLDEMFVDATKSTAAAQQTSSSSTSNRKLTTMVTLNLRKAHRRLSDIGLSKNQININDDGRHSICGVMGDGIDNNIINYQHNTSMIANALANSCYRNLDKYTCNTKYICCNCKKSLTNEMLACM